MQRILFILLILTKLSASLSAQSCTGFPVKATMIPCSTASSALANNANINSGGSFGYCGSSPSSYSGLNLSGGSIYICGDVTISSANFNKGTIYVACGAKLTFTNDVQFNSEVGIVNYGTVKFDKKLTFQNSDCFFYNIGYSSKLEIIGDFKFPDNQVKGFLQNAGKVEIGGTLNLGAGGLICAGPGSVINTKNFIYGGANCNGSDYAANRLLFSGTNAQNTIFQYTATAELKSKVTNSTRVKIYVKGSAPSYPCNGNNALISGWGSANVINSEVPALPANISQAGCLSNGMVNCLQIVVLPVELIYFRAEASTNAVNLAWATGTERNNDYWTIERSADLEQIEQIGKVDGSGNSSQLLKYQFQDDQPQFGVMYYRISQHDFDGKKESFDWVSVDYVSPTKYQVYPNPSAGIFKITSSITTENVVNYQVIDFSGKPILQSEAFFNKNEVLLLNLESFPTGVYYLKIQSEQDSWTTKLVKL